MKFRSYNGIKITAPGCMVQMKLYRQPYYSPARIHFRHCYNLRHAYPMINVTGERYGLVHALAEEAGN